DDSPLRQRPSTVAEGFTTAAVTEVLRICRQIAHDGDFLSRVLGIGITFSWPPIRRTDQHAPIRIQAADIEEMYVIFCPISLFHISSLWFGLITAPASPVPLLKLASFWC